jgi:hypothetical protein
MQIVLLNEPGPSGCMGAANGSLRLSELLAKCLMDALAFQLPSISFTVFPLRECGSSPYESQVHHPV